MASATSGDRITVTYSAWKWNTDSFPPKKIAVVSLLILMGLSVVFVATNHFCFHKPYVFYCGVSAGGICLFALLGILISQKCQIKKEVMKISKEQAEEILLAPSTQLFENQRLACLEAVQALPSCKFAKICVGTVSATTNLTCFNQFDGRFKSLNWLNCSKPILILNISASSDADGHVLEGEFFLKNEAPAFFNNPENAVISITFQQHLDLLTFKKFPHHVINLCMSRDSST